MSKTYVYEPNGLRPQLVDSNNASADIQKEIYVYKPNGTRPIRTTIENSYELVNEYNRVYTVSDELDTEGQQSISFSGLVKPFTLRYDTSLPGGTTISLPRIDEFSGGLDFVVDWGDSVIESGTFVGNGSALTHTYEVEGIYTVRLYLDGKGAGISSGIVVRLDFITINCVAIDGFPSTTGLSFYNPLPANHNVSVFNESIPKYTNIRGLFRSSSSDVSVFENLDLSAGDISLAYLLDHFSDSNYPSSFYAPVTTWNVSGVTNTIGTFSRSINFNEDVSGWDVSNVTNTSAMFQGCANFNRDISGWDVSSVTSINNMFSGCTNFDQDLGSWDIGSLQSASSVFLNSGMSSENLQRTIIGWANYVFENNKPSNINLGTIPDITIILGESTFEDIVGEFNDYISARDYLVSRGWSINTNVIEILEVFDSVAEFQADVTLTYSNINENDHVLISNSPYRVGPSGTAAFPPFVLVNSSVDPVSVIRADL